MDANSLAYGIEQVAVFLRNNTQQDACQHVAAAGGGHACIARKVLIHTAVRGVDVGVMGFFDDDDVVLPRYLGGVGVAEEAGVLAGVRGEDTVKSLEIRVF